MSGKKEEKILYQSGETCCLIENGNRCGKPATAHLFTKTMLKIIKERGLDIYPDPSVEHSNTCSMHKRNVKPHQTVRAPHRKSRKNDSGDEQPDTSSTGISKEDHKLKLHILPAATLRRYKKQFKLQTRPGLNKHQLADSVGEHFKTIPINEKEIITYFIYTVKTNKNKLDQKPSSNNE